MSEMINYQLFETMMTALSQLYLLTFYHAGILSFLAGLITPTIYFDKPEKNEKGSVLRRLFIFIAVVLFCFGTLSNFTVPAMINALQQHYFVALSDLVYPAWAYLYLPLFLLGIGIHVALRRAISPRLNKLKQKMTKKTTMARDERTDVRTVKAFLPETVQYDPEKYIDLNKGVFVGLDREHQPQYIPLEDIQKQHADIIGTTGAGKGVASGLILYQLILANEGVFVMDPKNDEWAPHLMKYACEKAGKPFYLIDLNKKAPQLDLLADATPEQIEELLVAGFSLAEKGDVADFYRIDDRKAAREAPLQASHIERRSFKNLLNTVYVQGIAETIKAFYGKLEELSLVESINAIGGMRLQDVYDQGGCCYVIGSMRNSKILITQKMILIRLFQLAETRDRVAGKPRPIAIFLDELKYHISKPAMEGLGAARDKGVHMFLAHQSIADLKDCPADLNGDAVVGAVVENTKFKLVYRLQDPDTAKWVSEMSGTILVDDETRYVEANKSLSEVVEDKRNIRMAERQYVDTNMLLNLPAFVSYIFTTNDVPKPSLIAPIKVQKQHLVTFDETQQTLPNEPEELAQESEEPMGESLVHEDEHSDSEGSPTPQGSDMNNDFNELDLDTFKPAGDEPKTTPQRNAEEEAAELEALSQQIDGFNE
ncbi:MFS transporter (plasmid) [Vibrio owensii]|uniref:MFS transporter n=3 Tax=Vibrio harveyi group TaxID=717610 RepID=A0ABM6ZS54_9VIBR|nr:MULTISPECIES: type IV secretory system conjugative DNA transfer family protein [Vibrio]AYO18512.1 MFS transporter [Vibrio owensii]MCZ6249574.1 TraM recognition domain-containing protein [Vibrio parahaemolyticus]MDE0552227.1 TraM recognition domain-containing protein [Vibrio sp. VP6]MDF4776816.1 TraM recognition domain-containing protein [Vibrio parahaemolyticus]MDG2849917.1 TraM recognition domain-containing protein [Vibrio parahaemolyticus]